MAHVAEEISLNLVAGFRRLPARDFGGELGDPGTGASGKPATNQQADQKQREKRNAGGEQKPGRGTAAAPTLDDL